jgi:serine phosphatase RsbU (regulator of sigma subunit)
MFTLTGNGRMLHYASARLELAVVAPGESEPESLEGDRMGVGYSDTPDDFVFNSKRTELPAGYRALVTTDGIIDQVGGPKSIAHGRKRLYRLLAERRAEDPQTFTASLLESFAQWQGSQHRRDDVCFFTFADEA